MSIEGTYYKRAYEELKAKCDPYTGSPVHIAITVLSAVDEPLQGSVNTGFRENLRNAKDTALKILISEMKKYETTPDNVKGIIDEKSIY